MATNSERELLEELRAFILELEAYRGEDLIDRVHDFLNRVHGAATGRLTLPGRRGGVDMGLMDYIRQHVTPNPKVNPYLQNRRTVFSSQLSEADKQALMNAKPGGVVNLPMPGFDYLPSPSPPKPAKTVTLEGQFTVPVMEKRFMDEAKIHAIKSTIRALTDEMLKQGIIRIEPVSSDTARGAEIYRVRVEMVKP